MTSTNFDELTKQIIDEHNKVRTDPQSYIEKLENNMKYFRGDVFAKPGEDSIQTNEGKAAYEEAIEFLKRQKAIPTLTHDPRLSQACADHIADIGPKGLATHESTDGKNVSDRIEKYCEWDGACCENIDFGTKNAEDIIINMIVDDGIQDRAHRRNVFNPELKYFGAMIGPHKEFETITVVDYVAGVRNHGEESPDVRNFISDYVKKSTEKGKGPKNAFQEDDPDAPDTTVSVKIVKTTKVIKGKPRKVTRKIYTLENNTQHIVEIEDV